MEEAQQRFFERVELAGEGELDKIRVLLEDAIKHRLQVRSPANAGQRATASTCPSAQTACACSCSRLAAPHRTPHPMS